MVRCILWSFAPSRARYHKVNYLQDSDPPNWDRLRLSLGCVVVRGGGQPLSILLLLHSDWPWRKTDPMPGKRVEVFMSEGGAARGERGRERESERASERARKNERQGKHLDSCTCGVM